MTISKGDARQNWGEDPGVTGVNGAKDLEDTSPTADRVAKREGKPRLTDDQIFWVLSNQRRRDIIQYLREQGGAATLGELAEWMAAKENGKTVQQVSSYERKRVYVGLHQNHLPMMDDMDVVYYDDDRKTIELRDTVTDLETYLNGVVEPGSRRLPSAAGFVIALVISLGTLRIGIFAEVPRLAWIFVGLISLLAVAVLGWHRGVS